MYKVASVNKIKSPPDAEQLNLYTDYTEFEHLGEALECANYLNQTAARYDTSHNLLGYVVYSSASPRYNIIGIGRKTAEGDITAVHTIELQPLEVAKMAVDFFNDNNPITVEKASNDYVGVLKYSYFIPKGVGQ